MVAASNGVTLIGKAEGGVTSVLQFISVLFFFFFSQRHIYTESTMCMLRKQRNPIRFKCSVNRGFYRAKLSTRNSPSTEALKERKKKQHSDTPKQL